MKKGFLASLAIGLLMLGMVGMANASSIAFDFTDNNAGYTNGSWVFGQKFTVGRNNITVTHLGYYDAKDDGFIDTHEVGIFTEAGSLLASTTVITTDTLDSHFRWHSISDLTLFAGQSYRVVGVSNRDDYNGFYQGNYTVDSRIIDNGFAYVSGTTLGIGNDYTGVNWFWAPNFKIDDGGTPTVPEPATMILFGLGLLGLAGVTRKQK